MPFTAIATAVGSTIGGIAQAGAASKAAKAQVDYGNSAIQSQRDMFDLTRSDLSPYNMGGQADFAGANKLLTDPQNALENLPGYQFTRTQGLKAVQNSAAARGLGVSGAAQKGAATFATGLADTTYGAQFNRLMSGAQLGEQAAAQEGNFATQTGSNIANTQVGQGQAVASGALGVGNAFSNIAGGVTNALLLPKQYQLVQGMYGKAAA